MIDRKTRDAALAVYARLLDAWNRQDADSFAQTFAEDGNAVGFDGSQMNGRSEVASTLRAIFIHHKTARYVARIRDVREIAPGVALIRSVVGMVPPGQTELNPAVNAIQSVIVVGTGGNLMITLLHNTPAAFHGRPELAQQLTSELTEALRTGETVIP